MIERRTILKALVAATATTAVAELPLAFGWFRRTLGFSAATAYASEVVIGERCLASIDPAVSRHLLERVHHLLPLSDGGLDEAGRAALEDLRRHDFEIGHTVNVDGWVLSETEVGIWLAQAHSAARRVDGSHLRPAMEEK